MDKTICDKCGLKKICKDEKTSCAAIRELKQKYHGTRREVAEAFLRRSRKLLAIEDSEMCREYRSIARKIIKTHEELQFIEQYDIRVVYLKSYEAKTKAGKMILGECIKIKELYKSILPYDFMIVLYEPNISYMTKNQIRLLIWHELMHIDIGTKPGSFKIAPHDVEDFYRIIDEHGMRWDEPGAKVPDIIRTKSHE